MTSIATEVVHVETTKENELQTVVDDVKVTHLQPIGTSCSTGDAIIDGAWYRATKYSVVIGESTTFTRS